MTIYYFISFVFGPNSNSTGNVAFACNGYATKKTIMASIVNVIPAKEIGPVVVINVQEWSKGQYDAWTQD